MECVVSCIWYNIALRVICAINLQLNKQLNAKPYEYFLDCRPVCTDKTLQPAYERLLGFLQENPSTSQVAVVRSELMEHRNTPDSGTYATFLPR